MPPHSSFQSRSKTAGLAVFAAVTLCAALALALAGRSLWGTLTLSSEATAVVDPVFIAPRPAAANDADSANAAEPWGALFGMPARAAAPTAPRTTLDHVLKGIVAAGETRWAILSDSGGDRLVQEGDVLDSGAAVEEIGPEGVWLHLDDRRALVAFSDDAPVRVASVELGPAGDGPGDEPRRQEVRTQSLTPIELRDLILRAEAERAAKGLVPPPAEEPASAPAEDRPSFGEPGLDVR